MFSCEWEMILSLCLKIQSSKRSGLLMLMSLGELVLLQHAPNSQNPVLHSVAIPGTMRCPNSDHPLLLQVHSLCLATPKHRCLPAKYFMDVLHMTFAGRLSEDEISNPSVPALLSFHKETQKVGPGGTGSLASCF